jgi:hypothetical protein
VTDHVYCQALLDWSGREVVPGNRVLGRRSRLGAATGIGASGAICPRRRPSWSSSLTCLGRQSQARQVKRESKRRLYSRDHGLVGDHHRDLAMPLENTVHKLCGQSVGGVSERAGVKAGGSNPFAYDSFTCRGGERHPGRLEGGALRGASSERGPRSVRRTLRVSPRSGRRADDSGCPEGAEEGNAVAHAPQSTCTRRRHEKSRMCSGDASFTRSFDPCTSILTTHPGASLGGEAFTSTSRLGKPTQVGGTSTGVGEADGARLAACPSRAQARGLGMFKKRKEVEASVPARIKSPGWVARTSVRKLQKSVGDVWPRISSANALQKERSGSS